MSRLIDKDELMKALNISYSCSDCEHKNGAFCNKASEFVWACETICDAPTVNQWISCSERLPELKKWVLVSSGDCVVSDCLVVRDGNKIWYECGRIDIENDAWMPLPEPYKEDTND